jgi:hypothetical protein
MIGLDPEWDFAYTHYPYTRSMQHYRDLISILDIGLAPLHASRMNDGKSDLKWLDYTMAGVATIASKQPAFATIKHGVTGLVARTPRVPPSLQAALDDRSTRWMIGAARHRLAERRVALPQIYLLACRALSAAADAAPVLPTRCGECLTGATPHAGTRRHGFQQTREDAATSDIHHGTLKEQSDYAACMAAGLPALAARHRSPRRATLAPAHLDGRVQLPARLDGSRRALAHLRALPVLRRRSLASRVRTAR